MAFSLKIEFFTEDTQIPAFIIEPHWWNISILKSKYKFREEKSHSYRDYYLDLTMDLLTQIHEDQYKNLEGSLYMMNGWISITKETLEQLNNILRSPEIYKRISIMIYEWESGY